MDLYETGMNDLRELWDSYFIEPGMAQDFPMCNKDDDWCNIVNVKDKALLGVVLRDRLMTDAAFGGPRPIKSEHSYSLSAYSPPASPATSGANPNPSNFVSVFVENPPEALNTARDKTIELGTKIDDMEEECFPAISMKKASSRDRTSASLPSTFESRVISTCSTASPHPENQETLLEIKNEPIDSSNISDYESQPNFAQQTITIVTPQQIDFHMNNKRTHVSDSEEDEEEYYQSLMELEECETQHSGSDDGRSHESLPPTPPSSASSDSEGTVSASCSPERRNSHGSHHMQDIRGILDPRIYITNAGHSSRQPIHTALISSQPKGTIGALFLTDEEKKTLIAEGYSVPTKLPLTKQEEKSLKKIRRKIKNKISAQESRRKKKEYMDNLERRVRALTTENSSYKDRLSTLENANRRLLRELEHLRGLIKR